MTKGIQFTCSCCDEVLPASLLSGAVARAAGMNKADACQELPAERLLCRYCDDDSTSSPRLYAVNVGYRAAQPVYHGVRLG